MTRNPNVMPSAAPAELKRTGHTPSRRLLAAGLQRAVLEPGRVAFLDIETTGLSSHYHHITLIGLIVGGEAHCWLAGDDFAEVRRLLAGARTLVTFNGKAFDLKFIRKLDPEITVPTDHIDLRYAVKHAGLTGGQKKIERELGLGRGDLDGADGGEAVSLWRRYARGESSALRRLIDYNRADLDGMRAILDHLVSHLGIDENRLFAPSSFLAAPVQPRVWAHPASDLPSAVTRGFRPVDRHELFGDRLDTVPIVGLDLTGSAARPSGYALLVGGRVETARIGTDEEMIERIVTDRPRVVSIDSPLCLPAGRVRVGDDDPGRAEFGIMRQCERTLKRRGINVYPCLLPSMQRLTERGMALATRLRSLGVPVIESYPGAAQDIVGLPRKQNGLAHLASALAAFGISGPFLDAPVSHDELDAITCALVGAFFLERLYEPLDGVDEGPLIVPSLERRAYRRVIGVSGRIAAGKTTLARMLEERGFAYARYSQVVADEVLARGLQPDRATMQSVGWELSTGKGQRWLGAKVLEKAGEVGSCVIDGLRFPDDAAFLFEQAGLGFTHVHIDASFDVRCERYAKLVGKAVDFASVDGQPVEAAIGALATVADLVVTNEGGIDELRAASAVL